jgi:hypothetical protein
LNHRLEPELHVVLRGAGSSRVFCGFSSSDGFLFSDLDAIGALDDAGFVVVVSTILMV